MKKSKNKKEYTAVYQKRGKYYIGWVEELPGVNVQEKTLQALKSGIILAIKDIETMNDLVTKQHAMVSPYPIFKKRISV